jgi:hypothetical protein
MGLFGEVGSIMAPAKKLHREAKAYSGYRTAVIEELGDALWYFSALCRRLGFSLADLMAGAADRGGYSNTIAASDLQDGPLVRIAAPSQLGVLDNMMLELGVAAGALLDLDRDRTEARAKLEGFSAAYLNALHASGVTFAAVARGNIQKVRGRFLPPDKDTLPNFDASFGPDERLPDYFEIRILQRRSGQSALQWNGVFIGDPLTDNIRDPDGFRFHDVFHFAHAAILHWSPTFRALIKHKRKSVPAVDEAQDGGRAIVVEEGLTAWLFSRAKELDYFEGQTGVSLDLLKVIKQFVAGYEVDACPLQLWEDAILQGYAVFREVRKHNGGIVIGDRANRTLRFQLDGGAA